MSDTTIFTKGRADGWVLVASAADNVSIKSNSTGFWHVAVAAEKPADSFEGEKYEGGKAKQILGLSGGVYVRVATDHTYAVTVGALQQGVMYGLDDSGALVAQGMEGDASKIYALARNMVRVSSGTYDATEILGYRVLVPGTGTLTISPVGGVADVALTTAEVNAMGSDVFPEHLDSITLGNADMEILVYTP